MNESIGIIIGAAVASLYVAGLMRWKSLETRSKKSETALRQINKKLDALLKNAGIQYEPYADVPIKIVEAIQNDQKIKAIKLYRKSTGSSLKEAKEYVEEIMQR